jgi:hypothetical protein
MRQEFLRLAVYLPVDEASQGSGLAVASDPAVQEIMRVIRGFGFAGSVGTYRAVAQISGAADTFTPTADSAPVHGTADIASTVASARIVTYVPAATPAGDVDRLIAALVSAHPWEHPLVEVDRVSLWMPSPPASAAAPQGDDGAAETGGGSQGAESSGLGGPA